jgi:hypothetical protein
MQRAETRSFQRETRDPKTALRKKLSLILSSVSSPLFSFPIWSIACNSPLREAVPLRDIPLWPSRTSQVPRCVVLFFRVTFGTEEPSGDDHR